MRYRWADDVAWDETDGCVVVLDPQTSHMLTLNSVGSAVWRRLDSPQDLDAIVDHLSAAWPDVGRGDLERDAREFLASLVAAGTVVADSP
jgi:hypothetical protein